MPDELVTKEEQVQERQRRAAREAAEAKTERALTETDPGGRYLVDGVWRDAEGHEVKQAKEAR